MTLALAKGLAVLVAASALAARTPMLPLVRASTPAPGSTETLQPAPASQPAKAGLPSGPGADVTSQRCLSCHEADLIVQQRLSEAGWDRELTKMARWGAAMSDDERAVVLRYLTRAFGPRPFVAAEGAAVADGERVYRASCLSCHEEDLAAQQRLNRAGWIREIDKMVRWGAAVSDAQKGPLADYLTSRWGRP